MSDPMEIGREVHSIEEYERLMKERPEPVPQPAEDRVHQVVYIDAESSDGKLRALLNANSDKPTVIVIDASNFDNEDWLKQLMARKKQTMEKLFEMPPKVLFDESLHAGILREVEEKMK